jgi:hypothetical protein
MTAASQTIILRSNQHFGRRVPSKALGCLLEMLPDTVRQSVRMAVEGRSQAKGKRPDWLRAAADIRFLGYEGEHETVLHFEAPTFGEAAPRLYEQQELWPTKPAPEDSGFDILADLFLDVAAQNVDSERFDRPLLGQVYGLRHVLNGTFHEMALTGRRHTAQQPVVVTLSILEMARNLYTNTPLPQQVRIAGKLDMLRASTQSFAVLLDDGQEIRGVLREGDIEQISPLLNRRVLVLGKAVYRPSGRLLRVDVEEVTLPSGQEDFFSTIPKPIWKHFELRDVVRQQQHKMGIAAVIGKWPGEESDEEIEQALKELS